MTRVRQFVLKGSLVKIQKNSPLGGTNQFIMVLGALAKDVNYLRVRFVGHPVYITIK
jgi:hypothetical protein